MNSQKWQVALAIRDLLEIVLILAFVVIVPPLAEKLMIQHGFNVGGTNRIVASSILFILWVLFAALLLKLNGEGLSAIGLGRPSSVVRTILLGLLTAAIVFAVVVILEHLDHGTNRLGDIGTELRGNPWLVAQRIAISLLIVGFVEEFIFRGFILTRLAYIFGRSNPAWILAIIVQAALFGLSHGYQQLYGMILTGAIGLFFGLIFVFGGRNLWIVIIGHGVYDAAHALYLSGSGA